MSFCRKWLNDTYIPTLELYKSPERTRPMVINVATSLIYILSEKKANL